MTGALAGLTTTTFLAFCGAAVALILTPGPDTMYVLARGMQGRGAGVRSALGISTGVLVHTAAAALGLAALLRAAPTAYRLVKYAGAAYLVYLGVSAVRDDEFDPAIETDAEASFRRGVLVNALNPKVALFFLAFLPGFAGSGSGADARMLLLGATYAALTALYLTVVAVASGRVGRILSSSRFSSGLSWLGGSVMVALGVGVAVD
ncbi:Threonine/homoserine/homoserine lactone efflux protein [Halogeometricum rufum]|uniref:Threonine/homoserine/homoserine lactone efflux protein n=1 Tax=Halogeometricum rufum TaxID=553469 RepID=A0A1I6FYC8_9EURY|nr:LysE family translocator [Halogeometricum rufum]SFR34952.1 Threonine/homoserine/homoserine lactone efflux protein [Halogeometricum rufum]